MKDVLRSVHRVLIDEGIRDEMTLLASGGIAMAEHVAKAILCGADAVVIDFPILIALECRMCRPVRYRTVLSGGDRAGDPIWVASRVYNLFGAFYNQLLEVMGAMESVMPVGSEGKWAGPCFLKSWTALFLEAWERSRKDLNLE